MNHRPVTATLLSLLSACSPFAPPLPEGKGSGVVAADATPPAGAPTWNRPSWRPGDRFSWVRGEHQKGEFRVVGTDDGIYVIDTGGDVLLRRDHDLGNLGEWSTDGEPLHLLSPADTRYHWPLWVGKRWSCEFVDRTRGAAAYPVRADYVVEDVDTVTVPAGTFQALRVVRTARRVGTGDAFLVRSQIVWYAPEAGIEVRHIAGDTMVELVARGSGR